MEDETYQLYRGPDLLGTVVLKDELCDFPWYGGQFKATPAFAAVEDLFSEERRLLEEGDMEAWDVLWSQIERPGLKLSPAGNGAPISNLIIHIDGEQARWRF